jgi:hypothetical protein
MVLAFDCHRMEIAKVDFFALLVFWKFCPIAIEILPIAIEPAKHKVLNEDFSINSDLFLMNQTFSERYLIDL